VVTLVLAAVLGLASCADTSVTLPKRLDPGPASSRPTSAERAASTDSPSMMVERGLTPPATKLQAPVDAPLTARPRDETPATVNLQQVPLPNFVQIVYAEVLRKSVNLDPQVQSRQDLVTFRSGGGETAEELERAVRLVLKGYGISAVDVGGVVRVLPDNAALGDLPSIRWGAALPGTPLSLRPVFQLVQLRSVRQGDVTTWLRTLFGERIRIQEDPGRNSLLISGNPDNVRAVLEALEVLDQPVMNGRASLSLSPAYWSADELARRLFEILMAEGYTVHPVGTAVTPGASRSPIILLPVSSLNVLYVFATSDTVLEHVAAWARKLDRPSERRVGRNFYTYVVKHKEAESLAITLDRVLSGGGSAPAPAAPSGQAPSPAARTGSVVVDKATNSLIFQSTPEEYGQVAALLERLDRPTRSALIEVTVAELSLNDSSQLGIEWLLSSVDSAGRTSSMGTLGTLGVGNSGFNFRVLNGAGQLRLALNALASDNRATILSSPRVMARNGELATIQVGQEVPIITSQQSTAVPGTTGAGLLQTVQYRSAGVILRVKPSIHSGDQIDLDVTQEVSQAQATETGVANSPTFSTRRVETKLSVRSGSTVMLGGLISEDASRGSAGVPFLKDIPGIGAAFSRQAGQGARRELIVLITPYVANDSHEAEAITNAFRNSLGSWLKDNPRAPGGPAPSNPAQTPARP
jgi:general secretion pathway protein D